MVDNFPVAESVRKTVENQKKYEIKEANEVLPEILEQMIRIKADDLCSNVSIPALPCPSMESATLIKEFYTNFYFSLYYLNYKEEMEKISAGLADYATFKKQLDEASKYYYLRYLFEDKNILTSILNLLKQQGFEAKVVKEFDPSGGNEPNEKLSLVISWMRE